MTFTFDPTINPSIIIALASLVIAWWRTRNRNIDERFASVAERMTTLESDVTQLKQNDEALKRQIDAMPGKDDMHGLQLLLSEMGGDMRAMRATMKSMAESQSRLEDIVTRHEDYLRDNK